MQMIQSELAYNLESEIIKTIFYIDALEELLSGVSEEKLQEDIDHYIYIESYLACEGIKNALDKYKQLKLNNGKTQERF